MRLWSAFSPGLNPWREPCSTRFGFVPDREHFAVTDLPDRRCYLYPARRAARTVKTQADRTRAYALSRGAEYRRLRRAAFRLAPAKSARVQRAAGASSSAPQVCLGIGAVPTRCTS